jgi:hypothetical protein
MKICPKLKVIIVQKHFGRNQISSNQFLVKSETWGVWIKFEADVASQPRQSCVLLVAEVDMVVEEKSSHSCLRAERAVEPIRSEVLTVTAGNRSRVSISRSGCAAGRRRCRHGGCGRSVGRVEIEGGVDLGVTLDGFGVRKVGEANPAPDPVFGHLKMTSKNSLLLCYECFEGDGLLPSFFFNLTQTIHIKSNYKQTALLCFS